MNLFEIIDKFNLNPTTDKNSVHCYVKGYYEKEFFKYKDKKIILLEIGINSGGSMKLWAEYFTNCKKIIGIDTNQFALKEKFKELEKVEYHFTNAYTQEMADKIPKLDIFLDDGPHTLESQIDAIHYYLPKIKVGGLFLIEDVQDMEWFSSLEEKVNQMNTGRKYKIEKVDLRHMKNMYGDHRYDDLIFAVKVM
jgi:cephalosporin hydroxylase